MYLQYLRYKVQIFIPVWRQYAIKKRFLKFHYDVTASAKNITYTTIFSFSYNIVIVILKAADGWVSIEDHFW